MAGPAVRTPSLELPPPRLHFRPLPPSSLSFAKLIHPLRYAEAERLRVPLRDLRILDPIAGAASSAARPPASKPA